MTGKDIFENVPVLNADNYREVLLVREEQDRGTYYKDLKDCTEVLKKKYNGIVNGLWYCMEPDIDGGAYFICRTKNDISDTELGEQVHLDILAFTAHAYLYEMTDDSTEGIEDLPIEEWKNSIYIYAIYDTERGIG